MQRAFTICNLLTREFVFLRLKRFVIVREFFGIQHLESCEMASLTFQVLDQTEQRICGIGPRQLRLTIDHVSAHCCKLTQEEPSLRQIENHSVQLNAAFRCSRRETSDFVEDSEASQIPSTVGELILNGVSIISCQY